MRVEPNPFVPVVADGVSVDRGECELCPIAANGDRRAPVGAVARCSRRTSCVLSWSSGERAATGAPLGARPAHLQLGTVTFQPLADLRAPLLRVAVQVAGPARQLQPLSLDQHAMPCSAPLPGHSHYCGGQVTVSQPVSSCGLDGRGLYPAALPAIPLPPLTKARRDVVAFLLRLHVPGMDGPRVPAPTGFWPPTGPSNGNSTCVTMSRKDPGRFSPAAAKAGAGRGGNGPPPCTGRTRAASVRG